MTQPVSVRISTTGGQEEFRFAEVDTLSDFAELESLLEVRGFTFITQEEGDEGDTFTYRNGDGTYLGSTYEVDVTCWFEVPVNFTPIGSLPALP